MREPNEMINASVARRLSRPIGRTIIDNEELDLIHALKRPPEGRKNPRDTWRLIEARHLNHELHAPPVTFSRLGLYSIVDATNRTPEPPRSRGAVAIVNSDLGRVRLLILATRVPLRSGDGTPSFVLDNAAALGEDFDITILAPRVSEAIPESSFGGVRVSRFAYFPRRWERLANDAIMPQLTRAPMLWPQAFALVLGLFLGALREHRRHRFNVVHAQWIIPSGLVARLLQALLGIPYLITARGADVFRLNQRPFPWLKRQIINNSSRLIAVSRDIAEHIDGLTVPVDVQPSGIDFALWEQLVGRRQPEPGKVLFVGRLATKKGVEVAIRAIAKVEDTRLVIVGDGPLLNDLERLAAELGVMHQVDFRLKQTRIEVAEQMRTAACVVIPSVTAADGDRDGTPNVLGEAIAAGVPVVGSRIAGIAEHLTDGRTGLLFAPGDVDGLCDQLRRLRAMDDPSSIAQAAQSELRDMLDVVHVSRRYSCWYRSTAARGDIR